MNKIKALLIIALIVAVGVGFFFFRLYQKDVQAITDFTVAYEKFDQATRDFSKGGTKELSDKALNALQDLKAKAAAFKVSSLVKNDPQLMSLAQQIADFSGQEMDNISAYKQALQNKSDKLNSLMQEYGDIANRMRTAYTHFREFAGLNN